jgi:hypothetical protein
MCKVKHVKWNFTLVKVSFKKSFDTKNFRHGFMESVKWLWCQVHDKFLKTFISKGGDEIVIQHNIPSTNAWLNKKGQWGAKPISQEWNGCQPSKLGQYLGMEKFWYNSTMPSIIGMSLFELKLGKEAKK